MIRRSGLRITSILLTAIVAAALMVVLFVVVVGGIVCIKDDRYDFAEYVSDLTGVYTLLGTAIVGALAQAFLPRLDREVNGAG